MNSNYVKYGIVDASGQLTELGKIYGLYAILRTREKNRNDVMMTGDTWAYVEACYIPDDVINMKYGFEDNEPLTLSGIRWLKRYIRTHDFNPYFYAQAQGIDIRDVRVPA